MFPTFCYMSTKSLVLAKVVLSAGDAFLHDGHHSGRYNVLRDFSMVGEKLFRNSLAYLEMFICFVSL